MTWFKQLLDAQFSSPIPFDFAKAAALRGFVVEDAGSHGCGSSSKMKRPGLSKLSQRLNSEFIQRRWPATGSDGSAQATTSTIVGTATAAHISPCTLTLSGHRLIIVVRCHKWLFQLVGSPD
jgi:hypothetical protein